MAEKKTKKRLDLYAVKTALFLCFRDFLSSKGLEENTACGTFPLSLTCCFCILFLFFIFCVCLNRQPLRKESSHFPAFSSGLRLKLALSFFLFFFFLRGEGEHITVALRQSIPFCGHKGHNRREMWEM